MTATVTNAHGLTESFSFSIVFNGGTCYDGASCQEIRGNNPSSPDGIYTLDPDGDGPAAPFQAYCDMTTEGGGWTLALKADGNHTTFSYEQPIWTDTTTFNLGSPGHDMSEAKLESFNSVPFNEVRVMLTTGGETRALNLQLPSRQSSLQALFSAGQCRTSGLASAVLGSGVQGTQTTRSAITAAGAPRTTAWSTRGPSASSWCGRGWPWHAGACWRAG